MAYPLTIFVLLILKFTLSISNVIVEDIGRISNGIIVAPHQFPWYAALVKTNSHKPICGGALIDSYWVLTAEHCIPKKELPRVMAGYVNITIPYESGGLIVEVEKIFKYSEEMKPGNHDIALMKLKYPLYESNSIKHAILANNNTQFEGKLAYAIGNGQTDDTGKLPLPERLLYTELKILEKKKCPENYICTEEVYPQAGTCPGDSGSPLILKGTNILLGLVHGGNKACGHENKKSYYANVVLYLDWMRNKTGRNF